MSFDEEKEILEFRKSIFKEYEALCDTFIPGAFDEISGKFDNFKKFSSKKDLFELRIMTEGILTEKIKSDELRSRINPHFHRFFKKIEERYNLIDNSKCEETEEEINKQIEKIKKEKDEEKRNFDLYFNARKTQISDLITQIKNVQAHTVKYIEQKKTNRNEISEKKIEIRQFADLAAVIDSQNREIGSCFSKKNETSD